MGEEALAVLGPGEVFGEIIARRSAPISRRAVPNAACSSSPGRSSAISSFSTRTWPTRSWHGTAYESSRRARAQANDSRFSRRAAAFEGGPFDEAAACAARSPRAPAQELGPHRREGLRRPFRRRRTRSSAEPSLRLRPQRPLRRHALGRTPPEAPLAYPGSDHGNLVPMGALSPTAFTGRPARDRHRHVAHPPATRQAQRAPFAV